MIKLYVHSKQKRSCLFVQWHKNTDQLTYTNPLPKYFCIVYWFGSALDATTTYIKMDAILYQQDSYI